MRAGAVATRTWPNERHLARVVTHHKEASRLRPPLAAGPSVDEDAADANLGDEIAECRLGQIRGKPDGVGELRLGGSPDRVRATVDGIEDHPLVVGVQRGRRQTHR